MIKKEDSDIKIFNPDKKAENDSDMLSFVEGMNHHRQNGNVDKAKELGTLLGNYAYSEDYKDLIPDNVFSDENVHAQVCSLILFSTEAALNYYLPSQQLSTIAINSMHEVLNSKNSPMYASLKVSPAFSFYYLSVRKGGTDIPGDIGEAFAMLCRHEGEEKYINEGKNIYNKFLQLVEEQITKIQFAN